jgi:hypothetical protein
LTDFFLTETRITIHNKVVTKICIALQLLSGIGHALFLNHGVEVLTIHGVVGQFNLFQASRVPARLLFYLYRYLIAKWHTVQLRSAFYDY